MQLRRLTAGTALDQQAVFGGFLAAASRADKTGPPARGPLRPAAAARQAQAAGAQAAPPCYCGSPSAGRRRASRSALPPRLAKRRPPHRLPARRSVYSMPASASTRFIRPAASCGSASRPALSASANSSARWTTERAPSAPAIIRKCGWWPFK